MDLNIKYSYPISSEYDYFAELEKINLDEEKEKDLLSNNGFIISDPSGIKKDLKAEDGIFSPRFGQTLGDLNPFIDRYKCKCGALKSRINHGLTCPMCGTRVEFVDDNFSYFGWLDIHDPYCIIHPGIYKQIENLLGKGSGVKRSKLENIIEVSEEKDKDGYVVPRSSFPKDEPWFGLGMIGFVEKFDEIIEYYYGKKPDKKDYYDEIMNNRDKVFTHSIPVFTTLLRPCDVKDGTMSYEPTNALYNIMNVYVSKINQNKTRSQRDPNIKNKNLYKLQIKYNQLYKELEAILSGKKGDFRSLIGGRYNFSSRDVIVQDPNLRIDQITLPYNALVILLEQRIVNILHKMYNITFFEAHQIWYSANINIDERVKDIINSIIHSYPMGLPAIINRNPTIAYGSILQMFCIGMTESFTMSVPLQVLPLLAADFDGDVLNVFIIINKEFFERAYEIFNPRNSMYISRNNGHFNMAVCVQRDTLINANTLVRLGRDKYTQEQYNKLVELRERNKRLITQQGIS